jgi:hypothetical protein
MVCRNNGFFSEVIFQVEEFFLKLITNWKQCNYDITIINSNFLLMTETIAVLEPLSPREILPQDFVGI